MLCRAPSKQILFTLLVFSSTKQSIKIQIQFWIFNYLFFSNFVECWLLMTRIPLYRRMQGNRKLHNFVSSSTAFDETINGTKLHDAPNANRYSHACAGARRTFAGAQVAQRRRQTVLSLFGKMKMKFIIAVFVWFFRNLIATTIQLWILQSKLVLNVAAVICIEALLSGIWYLHSSECNCTLSTFLYWHLARG